VGRIPKAFPEAGAAVVSLGAFVGPAEGRYPLIMSCIDRERFFFMNEPAHSWPQLSAQSEVIPHLSSSPLPGSFNRVDYGGTKCISRCSVIVACPVHDFLTRFPNFSDPFDITPSVE
jgi:hypothetical protein